jgi:hypothetical protein
VRFAEKGDLAPSSKRQVATGTFVPDCRGVYLRSRETDPPTLDALSEKCAGTGAGAKPAFATAIAKANPDQRFLMATPGVASATFRYGQVVVVPPIPTPTARPRELVKLPPLPSATNPALRTTSFAASGTFTLQVDPTPQEASGTFRVLLGTPAKEVASATFAPGKAPALSASLTVQVGPYATATFEWKSGDGGLAGELVYGASDGEPENAKSLVGATVPSGNWTVWVRSTGADGNTVFAKVGILQIMYKY